LRINVWEKEQIEVGIYDRINKVIAYFLSRERVTDIQNDKGIRFTKLGLLFRNLQKKSLSKILNP
jgi:hypothetical protein